MCDCRWGWREFLSAYGMFVWLQFHETQSKKRYEEICRERAWDTYVWMCIMSWALLKASDFVTLNFGGKSFIDERQIEFRNPQCHWSSISTKGETLNSSGLKADEQVQSETENSQETNFNKFSRLYDFHRKTKLAVSTFISENPS